MIDTFEGVRQHVRDIVLGRDGYRESTTTYGRFGLADSDSLKHKGFAVGYLEGSIQGQSSPGRGNRGLTPVEGSVGVRFAWELSAKGEQRSYDAGLEEARLLAAAIVAQGRTQGVHLLIDRYDFATTTGWFTGTITLQVRHNIDLTI